MHTFIPSLEELCPDGGAAPKVSRKVLESADNHEGIITREGVRWAPREIRT